MKKYVILIFVAFLLAAAGYLLFTTCQYSEVAWDYIPESAGLIVTSDRLVDFNDHATDDSLLLKELPIINLVSGSLSVLSWFNTDSQQIRTFLSRKTITCSFHPRSGNSLGSILYIPVVSDEEREWLSGPQRKDIRMLTHTFQGEKIVNIHDNQSRNLFSYILKEDFLIISQFGDLIEDVIRNASAGLSERGLKSRFHSTESRPGYAVYVAGEGWKSVLLPEMFKGSLKNFLGLWPENMDFYLRPESGQSSIVFTSGGANGKDSYVQSWLKGQAGTPFASHKYISQQTSTMYRIASNDQVAFRELYAAWAERHETEATGKLGSIISKQKETMARLVGPELILCHMEESNTVSDGKILLARYDNFEKIRPLLYLLAKKTSVGREVAVDRFQGYEMFSVDIPELPEGLFGNVFTGFAKSYVTYVAPYLVFANNSHSLRSYIADYENQLTWEQSPEYDSLLSAEEEVPQLSLVVNLRKSDPGKNLNNPYIKFSKTSSVSAQLLESMVLECRTDGKVAFPRLTLNAKKKRTSSEMLNRTFLNVDAAWPVLYDSSLAGLLNPIDGSSEILLTNASKSLYRINNEARAKPELITSLDGNIATVAYKTDFLNIGRQQRIFATRSKLYVIDEDDAGIVTRLTGSLPGDQPVTSLYRTEGGQESGSRFVIHDEAGQSFIWDDVRQKPRSLAGRLRFDRIQKPVVSVSGQPGGSAYIFTEQSGKISLISEGGIMKPGFPVDLLTSVTSPFTWTVNSTGAQEIIGVTTFGEVTKMDINGKIIARTQLLRTESSNTFNTLYDANSLDWLMVRRSLSKVAILDKQGEVLFEIVNLRPGFTVQYHFFGSDNRFISVKSGNYTSVFDFHGKILGDKPIPSIRPVSVIYQAAFYKLLIFSQSPGKIQTWSIKLR